MVALHCTDQCLISGAMLTWPLRRVVSRFKMADSEVVEGEIKGHCASDAYAQRLLQATAHARHFYTVIFDLGCNDVCASAV